MSVVMTNEAKVTKAALFKERIIHGLIFLFPIAGVGVRHWFSLIFTLLVLISLWDWFKAGVRSPLLREEKIWLGLCAAFFFSSLVSGLANGWTETQAKLLAVDLRYLAIVPLYFMLRRYPQAWRCLLSGLPLAAVFVAGQAYFDVFVLGKPRAEGVYSPNLLGPLAAWFALWLLAVWHYWGRWRWLVAVLVLAALWALALSGSRGAYLGALAMGLVWALFAFRGWWRVAPLLIVLLAPPLVYQLSDRFAARVDEAAASVDAYIQQREAGNPYVDGIVVRFEMWRAAWRVFLDHPLLGVGRGNYQEAVSRFVGVDGIPVDVAQHGHAHNAYIDTLMTRGVLGFGILLAMLFYPLTVFLRQRRAAPETALLGILHITGIAVFSLTDASTFIKGNFISIYLLCLTVFLTGHLARIRQGS